MHPNTAATNRLHGLEIFQRTLTIAKLQKQLANDVQNVEDGSDQRQYGNFVAKAHDASVLDLEVKLRDVFKEKNHNADEHCKRMLPFCSFQVADNVKRCHQRAKDAEREAGVDHSVQLGFGQQIAVGKQGVVVVPFRSFISVQCQRLKAQVFETDGKETPIRLHVKGAQPYAKRNPSPLQIVPGNVRRKQHAYNRDRDGDRDEHCIVPFGSVSILLFDAAGTQAAFRNVVCVVDVGIEFLFFQRHGFFKFTFKIFRAYVAFADGIVFKSVVVQFGVVMGVVQYRIVLLVVNATNWVRSVVSDFWRPA